MHLMLEHEQRHDVPAIHQAWRCVEQRVERVEISDAQRL